MGWELFHTGRLDRSRLEEENLYALFAGLNISMDQTLTALEEIELFYEWSDNSADRVRWSSPRRGNSFILNKSARS
jgi:hypothetical protein